MNERRKITILATSDLHGKLYPWDYVQKKEDLSGSMMQLAGAVKELYDPNNTLLVDAGDTIQDNSLCLPPAATRLPPRGRLREDRSTSPASIQGEDLIDRLAKVGGHLEGEFGGGDELVVFDGVDGLACDADGVGQFLLRDAEAGPFDPDAILHGRPPSCICTA